MLIVTEEPAAIWICPIAVVAVTTGLVPTLGMIARSFAPGGTAGVPGGLQLLPLDQVELDPPVQVLSPAQAATPKRDADRKARAVRTFRGAE